MLETILNEIEPYDATLVAVSKTKPAARIEEMYQLGQRHFGENRVQELVEKYEQLPKDILWHQIGHLQTNKVKYIAPFVHLIHAVDSEKLINKIDQEAEKSNRNINILLQLKIAKEDSKYGLSQDDLLKLAKDISDYKWNHINLVGLMGMASFVQDKRQIKEEFKVLKNSFDHIKSQAWCPSEFSEISMGMSGDYKIALEEGSTMIRAGSLLFGSR